MCCCKVKIVSYAVLGIFQKPCCFNQFVQYILCTPYHTVCQPIWLWLLAIAYGKPPKESLTSMKILEFIQGHVSNSLIYVLHQCKLLSMLFLFWSVGKLPINILVNSALSELASGLHVSIIGTTVIPHCVPADSVAWILIWSSELWHSL